MSRSLMRHNIAELEQLFGALKTDPKTLKALEEELQHRQTPRAVALFAKVQGALKTLKRGKSDDSPSNRPKPDISPTEHLNQQPDLWSGQSKPVPQHASAPAVAQHEMVPPASSPVSGFPASISAPVMDNVTGIPPAMSAADAYKVLNATTCSTWETIEQTRRLIVQQAYPERIATFSLELRAKVQTEAKRANEAYAGLCRLRTRNIE